MHLYFISSGKYTKIGISDNPKRRLKQLQTGNPDKLILIDHVNTGSSDEAARVEDMLHKFYSHKRVRGEWFKGIDINEAKRLCTPGKTVSSGKVRLKRGFTLVAIMYCVALVVYLNQ
jgi:hypothetical protein